MGTTISSIIEDSGGRKFTFALIGVAIGLVLVYTNKITGQEYVTFFEVLGVTYVVGNVAAQFTPPPKDT